MKHQKHQNNNNINHNNNDIFMWQQVDETNDAND